MDREELLSVLRHRGVADAERWIEGVHQPQSPSPEFLFLRRAGNGWDTGVCERGSWHVVASFPDEAAACAHLLRLAEP